MSPRGFAVLLACLAATLEIERSCSADQDVREAVDLVVPVDWNRFHLPDDPGADYRQSAQFLLNAVRFNLGTWDRSYQLDEHRRMYLLSAPAGSWRQEHTYRPPAEMVYAAAAVLKTGIFNEQAVGLSQEELLGRTVKMIRGLAAVHKANTDVETGWGASPNAQVPNDTKSQQATQVWQSPLWAALAAQAGWMLWADLDPQTQQQLVAMVEAEANRFIAPHYRVPYWADQEHVLSPRDTKAEENAWNSMILQVAVAMMPSHPHARRWREAGSELMVSAFSLKTDLENPTVLDGKPIKDWLKGYNVREDGAVINHNLVHPDYMACITLNSRAFIVQSLAGQKVSQTADFNSDVIYRAFVTQNWSAPPYEPPGGTMYVPGRPEIYYPNGTDWSRYRFDVYYVVDVFACTLGWDHDLPHRAEDWMRLRIAKVLEMQARHEDRHVFAPGEFETYEGCEAETAWSAADAFLLHWLHACQAISEKQNWLDDDR